MAAVRLLSRRRSGQAGALLPTGEIPLSGAVLILAKAPVPGKVKTRLCGVLTPRQAAALHARLTRDLIARLKRGGLGGVWLYCHPHTGHPFFQALARRYRVRLRPQEGDDLGERMERALAQALRTHPFALALGCDCPSLTAADVRAALRALGRGNDVVLGPAEDGGYVLIGLRRPQPGLFTGIPWGSGGVLTETRRRCGQLGLKKWELPLRQDLDRPEDLQRYFRHQRNTTCRRR